MESHSKIKKIKLDIILLKQRLEKLSNILMSQEKMLNELEENTNSLLKEATSKTTMSEVLNKAFPSGKIPKILSK